jgi:hypothetical protein
LRQPEDDQEHAARDENRTADVEALPVFAPLVATGDEHSDHQERRNEHVDAERPTPGVVGRQVTAEDGSERGGGTDGRRPHCEREGSLATLERAREQGEGVGHEECGARPFDDCLTEDQHRHRRRQRRQQGADAEERGAHDDQASRTVDVAEATTDHQQARERQRVTGEHPLHGSDVRVEVVHDPWDGDGEHGVVDDGDRDRQQGEPERPPTPPIGRGHERVGGHQSAS